MGRGAPSGPPPRRALAPKRSACAVSERGDVGIEIQSAAGRERSVAGGYAGGAKANAFAAWTTRVSLLVPTDVPWSERPSRQNGSNPAGFPGPVANGCAQLRARRSRGRRGAARRSASRPVGVPCSRVSCFAPWRAFELRRTTRARGGRAVIERARHHAPAATQAAGIETREQVDRRRRQDPVPRHNPRAPRASSVKGKPSTTC